MIDSMLRDMANEALTDVSKAISSDTLMGVEMTIDPLRYAEEHGVRTKRITFIIDLGLE